MIPKLWHELWPLSSHDTHDTPFLDHQAGCMYSSGETYAPSNTLPSS